MQTIATQHFKILGTGSYLPGKPVASRELDRRCSLPAGWCDEHVGVRTRYECKAPESMVSMGCQAAALAIEEANVPWEAIDMIVDCSTSIYQPIPFNACHYQQFLCDMYGVPVKAVPCFDVHSTCLSSLVAINLANGLFSTGNYKNILLISAESGLGGVNYEEPQSACLIGDGAAAMVLGYQRDYDQMAFAHETYSEHLQTCGVIGGGHKLPFFQYTPESDSSFRFSMDGPAVFRAALQHLKPMIDSLFTQWETVSSQKLHSMHVIPHQASPRALRAVQKMLHIDEGHFHVAVQDVGNMIAASIPYMFDRARKHGKLSGQDRVLAMGTSAGYSQAAMIFRL